MCTPEDANVIDFDEGRYDLDSFWGRARHNFSRYNPFKLFVSSSRLEEAKCLYLLCRCGQPLPDDVTVDQIWKAKDIYERVYHPETGEKISFLARTPSQTTVNMILAGGMMAYCGSNLGCVFWQWLNQTYNAFVGYAHKTSEGFTNTQLRTSYIVATGTAVGTALGLHYVTKNVPPLAWRFIPLAAVATAHCINVPLLRAQMLRNGAPVYDDCHNRLGYSRKAAEAGISGIILNKILMALPPLAVTPLVINYIERRGTFCRYPWLSFPAHAAIAGFCLTFLSPFAVALLGSHGLLPYKHLEPELKEHLCKKFYDRPPKYVYYDKI